eukprot:SAG11_NODE_17818_length_508_cov_0.858191_1_plen_31_part_10
MAVPANLPRPGLVNGRYANPPEWGWKPKAKL